MSNRRQRRRQPVPIRESAAAATARVHAASTRTEPASLTIVEATSAKMRGTGSPRRYRARLIEGDRWGSSGYYPAKVLERDGPTAWPAGTLMYLDHPTISEQSERPERSVRDLGAKTVTDATYEGDGLYADIEVFPHAADLIEALADTIGLSVRGEGTANYGEIAGRSGPIVESVDRGYSVDFVTKAGAGGAIVSLLESARQLGLRETTTDVTRTALAAVLEDKYAGRDTYVWVRDFDPDKLIVWYDVSTGGDCDTWQQSYEITTDSAPVVTLTGKATQVVAQTTYAPYVDPDDPGEQPGDDASLDEAQKPPAPAPVTVQESAPTTTKEARMGTENTGATPGSGPDTGAQASRVVLGEAERLSTLLAESRTALAEANSRADKAEKRATDAERRATLAEAQRAAERVVRTKLAETDLKPVSHPAVVQAVCDSLELDESGKVDQSKLTEAIEAEVQAERTRAAQLLEAYGVGQVAGISGQRGTTELSDDEFEKQLSEAMGSIGLSESEAKTAARGRR